MSPVIAQMRHKLKTDANIEYEVKCFSNKCSEKRIEFQKSRLKDYKSVSFDREGTQHYK